MLWQNHNKDHFKPAAGNFVFMDTISYCSDGDSVTIRNVDVANESLSM